MQQSIKTSILDKVPVDEAACAYIRGKSVVDCAQPHQRKDLVVRLDIKEFFPSIGFGAVWALFNELGYNSGVSTCLALLCTDVHRIEEPVDNRRYYRACSGRHLPQGACTSPVISNMFFARTDEQLRQGAKRFGWTYTRYADDLIFSKHLVGSVIVSDAEIARLIGLVGDRLAQRRLQLNARKTHVMRKHQRQIVVGLSVNNKVSLPRKWRRQLRAIIHWCEKYTLHNYLGIYIRGLWSYLRMVDAVRATDIAIAHPWIINCCRNGWAVFSSISSIFLSTTELYNHKTLGAVMFVEGLQKQDYAAGPNIRLGYVVLDDRFARIPWFQFTQCARKIENEIVRWAILQKVIDSGKLNKYVRSLDPEVLAKLWFAAGTPETIRARIDGCSSRFGAIPERGKYAKRADKEDFDWDEGERYADINECEQYLPESLWDEYGSR